MTLPFHARAISGAALLATVLATVLVTVLATLLASASGCSQGVMLLESDVPLPSGMVTVRSADIRRAEGAVTGGTFVLAGEVNDAASTMSEAIARYEAAGWSVVSRVVGLDHAKVEFAKASRRVVLTIDRRALEPSMSVGLLTVTASTAG